MQALPVPVNYAAQAAVSSAVDNFVFSESKTFKVDPMMLLSDTACFWTSDVIVAPQIALMLKLAAPAMDGTQIQLLARIAGTSALVFTKGQFKVLGFKPRPVTEILARSAAGEFVGQMLF